MNTTDIIILLLLGINALISLFRGVIREMFHLVASVGGFFVASACYKDFTPLVSNYIPNSPSAAKLVSFIGVFIAFATITMLVGAIFGKVVKTIHFGWLDRLGGALFGVMKTTIIIGIILLTLDFFIPLEKSFMKDSKVSPIILNVTKKVVNFSPVKIKEKVDEKIRDIKDKIPVKNLIEK